MLRLRRTCFKLLKVFLSSCAALRAALRDAWCGACTVRQSRTATPHVPKGHVVLTSPKGLARRAIPHRTVRREALHMKMKKVEFALQAGAASPHHAPHKLSSTFGACERSSSHLWCLSTCAVKPYNARCGETALACKANSTFSQAPSVLLTYAQCGAKRRT
jgi:hypothetical protein